MHKQISTSDYPDFESLPAEDIPLVYSAMDTAMQKQLSMILAARLAKRKDAARVSSFEHAMLGPAFEMMQNGFLIDYNKRQEIIRESEVRQQAAARILDIMAREVWDRPLNANSPKQLVAFLYGACDFPEQEVTTKAPGGGYQSRISTNKEALEKLAEKEPDAIPFIALLQSIKSFGDILAVLHSKIDINNHIHYQFNPQGTVTGRFSSNSTPRGFGTNGQNLEDLIRRAHVAHPGNILISVDKAGAESLAVARISGDTNYLRAATSKAGVHAFVCNMIWPHFDWPKEEHHWKAFSTAIQFDRLHTLYDMGKRAGHATNYYITPMSLARHLKISVANATDFQTRYFEAFPKIRAWQRRTVQRIQQDGAITTVLGRRISFHGRTNDNSLVKKAIAAEPQSLIADDLNFGLWLLWRRIHTEDLPITLRLQVHDELVVETPEYFLPQAVEIISQCLLNQIQFPDGPLVIPIDVKVGWCWADYNDDPKAGPIELDGIKKWSDTFDRKRTIYPPSDFLDNLLS